MYWSNLSDYRCWTNDSCWLFNFTYNGWRRRSTRYNYCMNFFYNSRGFLLYYLTLTCALLMTALWLFMAKTSTLSLRFLFQRTLLSAVILVREVPILNKAHFDYVFEGSICILKSFPFKFQRIGVSFVVGRHFFITKLTIASATARSRSIEGVTGGLHFL